MMNNLSKFIAGFDRDVIIFKNVDDGSLGCYQRSDNGCILEIFLTGFEIGGDFRAIKIKSSVFSKILKLETEKLKLKFGGEDKKTLSVLNNNQLSKFEVEEIEKPPKFEMENFESLGNIDFFRAVMVLSKLKGGKNVGRGVLTESVIINNGQIFASDSLGEYMCRYVGDVDFNCVIYVDEIIKQLSNFDVVDININIEKGLYVTCEDGENSFICYIPFVDYDLKDIPDFSDLLDGEGENVTLYDDVELFSPLDVLYGDDDVFVELTSNKMTVFRDKLTLGTTKIDLPCESEIELNFKINPRVFKMLFESYGEGGTMSIVSRNDDVKVLRVVTDNDYNVYTSFGILKDV